MNHLMQIADQLSLPNGWRLLEAEVLPLDIQDHAGEHAVQLEAASGATAWGFGRSYLDAAADAREALTDRLEVVLQVWKSASGQYGGRILDGGKETGRVGGCETADEVEAQATEAGILFHRVETLEAMPPVL